VGAIVCSLSEWVICNWVRWLGSRKVRVHVEACDIHVEPWVTADWIGFGNET
jgi:hypothetical protein